MIRALLPVLDGFERALKHRDESVPESYVQGVKLIYQELFDVLSRAGVTPIETAGKFFDPHLHPAQHVPLAINWHREIRPVIRGIREVAAQVAEGSVPNTVLTQASPTP